MKQTEVIGRLLLATLFAIAFAFVESSVVVYLRAIYYPDGFTFPLRAIGSSHIVVELLRELATIVMLTLVAMLAAPRRWERFAYFLILFGIWDIFYYIWLKVLLNWPLSLTDWDILFLIPLPWIGPVIAPVLIALAMVVAGVVLLLRSPEAPSFRPSKLSWVLAVTATILVLFSFMQDTGATLRGHPPLPYHYDLLIAGLLLYAGAFAAALAGSRLQTS